MGAGPVPGAEPPLRVETVRETARTRITRLVFADRTVIRKQPLGPDTDRRVRRETAVLERVRGVDGVAQLVNRPRYRDSIVLADAGMTRLGDLAMPLAVDELLGLAVALARAVAGVHARAVLHRDIAPGNIVLSADGGPTLVDFAVAALVAELRPGFSRPAEIVGTLAYLAPEATGRTGRPVDQRADLYALGALLYELATGAPPFGAGDPLGLSHDHLARVPVPPAQVNPAVPVFLSEIVLHLLEKEPDRRYQTAEGLLFDLERLRDDGAQAAGELPAGAHDRPPRLSAPSRLVGREAEVAALHAAFDDALAGQCRGMLVAGTPGVGKTALVDQLRPVVTGRDGWFVAGKFDQYRRDLEFDAVHQAGRALGRLLLAEPEDELVEVRERIVAAVGANAGLLSATSPEFAALLAAAPDPGDPLTAQVRAARAAVEVVRAVASRKRPVVVFVDDLQWARPTPLGFVDTLLSEEPVEGLLLVGAYREGDVEAAHPLAAPLSRWREQPGVRHLRLNDLDVRSLVTMVAEMLHADPAAAAALSELIWAHTNGNPYETVELLGALRRDGLVSATADGWRWDAAAVGAHLGRSDVAGLLAARGAALPAAARAIVEAMACLGGRAELRLLRTATAESADVVDQALAPAIDDGVLMAEPGVQEAVRFRHDRIREAILRGLDPPRRRAMQLAMARRLAGVPELFAVAAAQYLPVIDAIDDATERPQAVGLLRRAADQAALIGDHALVNALLTAALRLIDPSQKALLIEVRTARHAALVSSGRLDEADGEYRTIEQLGPTPLEGSDARAAQVLGLTHRRRFAEAVALGLESLRELGATVPAADRLPAELDERFEDLYRWLDHTEATADLARVEITDPALLAASRLISATIPAASFATDRATFGWLSLEALRIWLEHGPAPTLVGPASMAAMPALELRGDYAAAYLLARRILAVGEARGYEPGISQPRLLSAIYSCWFEPIENGLEPARQAREGLLAGGDLAYAAYSYYPTVYYVLDSAPSLDSVVAEVEAALAFVRRTGNEQSAQVLDVYRWLADVLRGEGSAAADDAVPVERYADNGWATVWAHVARATAAAIFGDPAGLARHSAAAVSLPPPAPGHYPIATVRLMRGLALAGQARATEGDERGGALAELDEVTGWLAARAADAPENFLHLTRLLEAERAWALGDSWAAALAFDAARREVAGRRRPWHRALITERAALFHLDQGLPHTGRSLLAEARQAYAVWGATAKVAQLDWAYPGLGAAADTTGPAGHDQPDLPPRPRSAVTTGTLDLLGILAASQALSSETSLERLHARVVDVLGALTGATAVHLLLWDEERQDWLLPTPAGSAPVGAGHETAVPLSVLRYVQRTGEPLVVADATADDRFARDPHLADADCCSMLVLPILSRGTLRAVLLLENRLLKAAFSADRLDAVRLVAGQLAVSLDNAQLYAELTTSRARIVTAADQTRRRIERDLHDGAQQRLVSLALRVQGPVKAAVPPEADELTEQLDGVSAELRGVLEDLRELAHGIHPSALADGGLKSALKTLARRSPVPVRLHVHLDRRLPEPTELAAYFSTAEAMANVAKHAQAAVVDVQVDTGDDALQIVVRDDGRGGADLAGGTGLIGLKDRIEALDGRLTVHSPPGAGTTLTISLPLDNTNRPGQVRHLPADTNAGHHQPTAR
jgi:predicted ATPase/signal transduction histidine kinase